MSSQGGSRDGEEVNDIQWLVGVNTQCFFFFVNHSLPWPLLPLQHPSLSLCVASQQVGTSKAKVIAIPKWPSCTEASLYEC